MTTSKEPRPWFEDDDHALKTGFLVGTLLRAGVQCNLVRDDLGNYKPLLNIVIPEDGEIEPVRITVRVVAAETEDSDAR